MVVLIFAALAVGSSIVFFSILPALPAAEIDLQVRFFLVKSRRLMAGPASATRMCSLSDLPRVRVRQT